MEVLVLWDVEICMCVDVRVRRGERSWWTQRSPQVLLMSIESHTAGIRATISRTTGSRTWLTWDGRVHNWP